MSEQRTTKFNDVPRLLDWTGLDGAPFNVARVDLPTQLIEIEECQLNMEVARALRDWLNKVLP